MPELQDVEFALTDISEHNLAHGAADPRADGRGEPRCRRESPPPRIAAGRSKARATSSTASRIGGLEAYRHDIEIPLKYGVDQCVGDTICAGGILYGQRNIPVILDFCRDIREVAAPGARFLNYANPMAMNTWAAIDYGKVDTIGLCHGIQHGGEQIADVLGAGDRASSNSSAPASTIRPGTSTSASAAAQIGRDELVDAFERHPVYSKQEKVRIDVLKRFGFYSTESNGHLSEYLPWYRKRPDEIARWIDMSDWIHGETGGYLRHCTETRNWFETRLSAAPGGSRPADRSAQPHRPSTPATSSRRWRPAAPYRGHFNVKNNGLITNLPADAIVEIARLRRSLRPQHGRRHHAAARPAPRPASPRSTCSAWRACGDRRATSSF